MAVILHHGILAFRDKHLHYDIALKLHVKRHSQWAAYLAHVWNNNLYDSLLFDAAHIKNIIATFYHDEKLGSVIPHFPPFYTTMYPNGYEGSAIDREYGKQILRRLDCDVPGETGTPVFSAGSMFWYRPKAFAKLLNSDYTLDDFPKEPFPSSGTIGHGLERVLPYIAQDSGYHYKFATNEQVLSEFFMILENYMTGLLIRIHHCVNIKTAINILKQSIKTTIRRQYYHLIRNIKI